MRATTRPDPEPSVVLFIEGGVPFFELAAAVGYGSPAGVEEMRRRAAALGVVFGVDWRRREAVSVGDARRLFDDVTGRLETNLKKNRAFQGYLARRREQKAAEAREAAAAARARSLEENRRWEESRKEAAAQAAAVAAAEGAEEAWERNGRPVPFDEFKPEDVAG